jgi:TRAP-type C4-dicarboxylate transport system permease large subunit
MIGSALLFIFNPFTWMLVIYLTLKNKTFGQISVASIGMQIFWVLPFVIYFLLEYNRQEYPTQSDWDAGILELGVMSFVSIICGLVISVLVYGLLKRKRLENSKKTIGTFEPLTGI